MPRNSKLRLLLASIAFAVLPHGAQALSHAPRSVLRVEHWSSTTRAVCRLSGVAQELPVASRRAERISLKTEDDQAPPPIYFVMGGPGSGKGTQCVRLVERYGMTHLSAGDLLREEVRSGSELGLSISEVIDQGKIVASETTVTLLQNAMAGRAGPFLIDGFPRSLANLEAFEHVLRPAAFMLFLEVSEEEMEARLIKRGLSSGRSDDNIETIAKRFRTFVQDSVPVVDAFEARDCLRRIDAAASEEEVFHRVCDAFKDQQLDETSQDPQLLQELTVPAETLAEVDSSRRQVEPAPPQGFVWAQEV